MPYDSRPAGRAARSSGCTRGSAYSTDREFNRDGRGMGKNQQMRLAEQIASIPVDQPRVIVATGRYLGEGFDDELLDTLFLALPISWRGTLTQHSDDSTD
jgi:hypothetical protein